MGAWSDVITTSAVAQWALLAPAFVLAWSRWLGVLIWLPALGGAGVSIRLRIALAMLLAIVVLPVTAGSAPSVTSLESLLASPILWLGAISTELVLGSLLGLGVRILFSALQLAGELIDIQAGLAVQQVMNPLVDGETGPATTALTWLTVAVVFAAAPGGSDLALVDAMLQQFQTIPVGTSPNSVFDSGLPVILLQQALALAIQLAGPVLGAMSLISMATAWLGRSAPNLQVGPLVAPVRAAVSLALLTTAVPEMSVGLEEGIGALLSAGPGNG